MRSKTRVGGDFFGEGTYGCTFSPPPACTQSEDVARGRNRNRGAASAHIGKIFDDEESFNTEWNIAQKMAKVDPAQSIFLYPISKCTTTLKDIKKDRQAKKCSYVVKAVKAAKAATTTFPMVNMVKGGMTLEGYVRNNRVSPTVFLNAIIPILKGLKLLKRHNLVHHDLKFDNILFNPTTSDTKVIDFGLLVPLKGVYDETVNEYLYSNYWLHPPEYRIFQYVNNHTYSQVAATTKDDARKLLEENLKIIDINFVSGYKHTLKDIIIKKCFKYHCEYDEAFVKYMLAVCKRPSKANAFQYMTKHATKIDIYSLGITMTYLSMFLDYRDDVQKNKLMELIKHFVHPDPRKRPSPTTALALIAAAQI
jgi:serine/threonine protein kinase